MDSNQVKKLKVVYLAGEGRSGTTLLAQLLGEIPAFFNIGEGLLYLLEPNIRNRNIPCGSGVSVEESIFWKQVFSEFDIQDLSSLHTHIRTRNWHSLKRKIENRTPEMLAYANKIEKFFEIVAKNAQAITQSEEVVIIDSSKRPTLALMLSLCPNIELHVVHVVRDLRDVVASWSKPKAYLDAQPLWRVLGSWVVFNGFASSLGEYVKSYRLVLYSFFAQSPAQVMNDIHQEVTGKQMPGNIIANNEIELHVQYTLAGNPDKLSYGKRKIAYKPNPLGKIKHILLTFLAYPWLKKYNII